MNKNKRAKLSLMLLATAFVATSGAGYANQARQDSLAFSDAAIDTDGVKNGKVKKQNKESIADYNINISNADKNNYLPYLQVGGTRFFNSDSSKAATNFDFFIPIWQLPTDLVFSDMRVHDHTGTQIEGNFQLGYRHLSPEIQHLYGIYGAFDRKRFDRSRR